MKLSWTRITLLSCVILLLLTVTPSTGFETSSYCFKMCKWGRGGNLCKCSTAHFVGKRGEFGEGFAGSTEAEAAGVPGAEEESLLETDQGPFQGLRRRNRLVDVVLAFLQREANREGFDHLFGSEEGGLTKGSARLRRFIAQLLQKNIQSQEV